jgi:hypothetical protein
MVWMDKGFWHIPYPLFSYILLLVGIANVWQDRANYIHYIPLLILLLVRCLSNPITYTFIMTEARYEGMMSSIYPDFLGGIEILTSLVLCFVALLSFYHIDISSRLALSIYVFYHPRGISTNFQYQVKINTRPYANSYIRRLAGICFVLKMSEE